MIQVLVCYTDFVSPVAKILACYVRTIRWIEEEEDNIKEQSSLRFLILEMSGNVITLYTTKMVHNCLGITFIITPSFT